MFDRERLEELYAQLNLSPIRWSPESAPFIETILQVSAYILSKTPVSKKENKIPAGFIKTSEFSKRYNLASADWLIQTFKAFGKLSSGFSKKIKNVWYVKPDELIAHFASVTQKDLFPIMHRRCKRHIENSDEAYIRKIYEV